MNDRHTDELLNGAIDHTLDPAQGEELKQLLERDPRAAAKLEQLRRMTRDIEDLGQVDAPADLVGNVMQAVSPTPTRSVSRTQGGRGMARKVMFGLAAAAALVLGVFAITGYPPIGRGTEGSIDAAKRYQAPQLASKDVVLGDTAVQQFLQSDVFDRLMRDNAARKLLSEAKYREAFAQVGVANMLGESSINSALKDERFLAMFSADSAALAAFDLTAFRVELGDAAFVQAIADTDVARALSVDEFAAALRKKAFALRFAEMAGLQRLSDATYLKSIENLAVRNVVSDAQIAAAFSEDSLALRLKNNELVDALTSPAVIAFLKSNEIQAAMKSELFAKMFGLKAFQDAIAVKGVRMMLGDPNFAAAIKGPALEMALKQHEFSQAVASPQFEAALSRLKQ